MGALDGFKWKGIIGLYAFELIFLVLHGVSGEPPAEAAGPKNVTARPWLRICVGAVRSTGLSYLLMGSECTGGYMFSEPFSTPICVCGNGLWVFKTGYCNSGKTTVIFANENTCYTVDAGVKWVRYVGHPERAKIDSHYLISENWDYIERLRKSSPSRLVASTTVWTLAVGDDPENIFLPREKFCLKSDWRPAGSNPAASGLPYARVGRSEMPDPKKVIVEPHQAQQISYCPYFAKEETTKWIQPGGMLTIDEKGTPTYKEDVVAAASAPCLDSCDNNLPIRDIDLTTPAPPFEKQIFLEDVQMMEYPFSGEESMGKSVSDLEDMSAPKNPQACPPSPGMDKETDYQTLRMIRSQTSYSVKQVKGPKAYVNEFRYLQRARVIVQQKCPQLPPSLIKSMIRMFRYLLMETIETHPYKVYGTDESDKRIMEGLFSCYNATGGPEKNMTLVYKEESCPLEPSRIEFKVEKEEADKARNCSMRIPKGLKYSCGYDLVTEATWKTILFSHYYCSRHFANFSMDESEFYVAMERLFNPDILYRYFNPGNSYAGFKFAFQMYDLEAFMENLDKCLACSRDVSQYRVWLKRPWNTKLCPKGTGAEVKAADEFDFDTSGFVGIRKNPKYLTYEELIPIDPSKKEGIKKFQCYSAWSDGLYTRPRQAVPPTCGLGMSVVGDTVTFSS